MAEGRGSRGVGPATVKEIEAARGGGEPLMTEGAAAWRRAAAKAWATGGGVFEVERNVSRGRCEGGGGGGAAGRAEAAVGQRRIWGLVLPVAFLMIGNWL